MSVDLVVERLRVRYDRVVVAQSFGRSDRGCTISKISMVGNKSQEFASATMVSNDKTGSYRHCLLTDDCFFILFISRKEIRLRILPTPDLRPAASSLTILCVFGLAFGLLGITAPALRVKSDKNESRWEANFFKAFSKSVSLSKRPMPLI